MTQTFNLSLAKDLVRLIDHQAKKDFSSRSDYLRKAVLNQLKADGAIKVSSVDFIEYGDGSFIDTKNIVIQPAQGYTGLGASYTKTQKEAQNAYT